jgi:hypothetical protein
LFPLVSVEHALMTAMENILYSTAFHDEQDNTNMLRYHKW